MKEHRYTHQLVWTGNTGSGTSSYRAYDRAHSVEIAGKPTILGSSDALFRGDSTRHNPEDLFVASISTCHMLWYLGLCSTAGVTVIEYEDIADGVMVEENDGAGRFTRVVLRPRVKILPGSDKSTAERLHHEAHQKCFIANSLNFSVEVEPLITIIDPEMASPSNLDGGLPDRH